MNNTDSAASSKLNIAEFQSSKKLNNQEEHEDQPFDDEFFFPRSLDEDVNLWSTEDVLRFIRLSGQEDIAGTC